MVIARTKAVLADAAAEKAHSDAIVARATAKSYAPELELKGIVCHNIRALGQNQVRCSVNEY